MIKRNRCGWESGHKALRSGRSRKPAYCGASVLPPVFRAGVSGLEGNAPRYPEAKTHLPPAPYAPVLNKADIQNEIHQQELQNATRQRFTENSADLIRDRGFP